MGIDLAVFVGLMSRPPRLAASEYQSTRPFFLTICTDQRHPWFVSPAVVDIVLWHFLQVAGGQGIEITAYCFMPDHMHALLNDTGAPFDLRRYVHQAKQRSAHAFSRDRQARLWQEGYFDRALRHDEVMVDVVAYIVANPVRVGLVERVGDYPHWDAVWL